MVKVFGISQISSTSAEKIAFGLINTTQDTNTNRCQSVWIITSTLSIEGQNKRSKKDINNVEKLFLNIDATNSFSSDHVMSDIMIEIGLGTDKKIYSTQKSNINLDASQLVFENSKNTFDIAQNLYTIISNSSYHQNLVKGTVKLYIQNVAGSDGNSSEIIYVTLRTVGTNYYAYVSSEAPLTIE